MREWEKIIFIVGVGGTGGLLAGKLAKFLNKNDKLFLIDGDKVEYKNIVRQPFQVHDIGSFKSEALSKKINSVSQFKNCYSINKFLNTDLSLFNIIKTSNKITNIERYKNKIIIISSVDNHKTRLFIEDSIKQINRLLGPIKYFNEEMLLYIDSANEDIYGDIMINYFRSYLYNLKPENEKELIISEDSCEELINDGLIQQFSTNDQASNLILKVLSDVNNWNLKSAHIKFNNFNTKLDFIKRDKNNDWLSAN